MLPRSHPDRIEIAFDDHRLVANAGLMLPATLARRLGLPQLADRCLDLGHAPGRANTGDKLMTLVASAPRFHGGRLWPGATASTTPTRCAAAGPPVSWAARSRRRPLWGPSCAASDGATSVSLDRVSRELRARAWAAGGGPGYGPLTIDLDSTICETYGLSKEGARHHGYTGSEAITRCWPWLPAPERC